MSKELPPRLTNPLLTINPRLTFTSGPVSGKKMVVQVTNTGGDLGDNHFDLQMPGGGVGYHELLLTKGVKGPFAP